MVNYTLTTRPDGNKVFAAASITALWAVTWSTDVIVTAVLPGRVEPPLVDDPVLTATPVLSAGWILGLLDPAASNVAEGEVLLGGSFPVTSGGVTGHFLAPFPVIPEAVLTGAGVQGYEGFSTAAVIAEPLVVPAQVVATYPLLDPNVDSNVVGATSVLTGEPDLIDLRRSPAFVKFDGTQYLERPSSDSTLNGSATFSVAVLFDPELMAVGQSCTVVAKHNATDSQQGWRVSWDASTGEVTVRVASAGDGSSRVERTTAVGGVGIRNRSMLVFTYDETTPTLELYVNGTSSQGSQTNTGTPGTPHASTEPFSIGVDDPSNGGANPMRGAVYLVGFWDVALSSTDVAKIDRTGILHPDVVTADLIHAWRPNEITSNLVNSKFHTWIDNVGALDLDFGNTSGSERPDAISYLSTSPFFLRNDWDIDFADAGIEGQNLSSTYALSSFATNGLPTRRLYNVANTIPNISAGTNWRTAQNDLTFFFFGYKPVGTNTVTLFQAFGLELRYDRLTQNLTCVVGSDSSATLQNVEFDFGSGIFTGLGEGAAFIAVLRYNAAEDAVTVDINGIRYFGSTSATNDFTNSAAVQISDQTDYIGAITVPACLSDVQVQQVLLGYTGLVYGFTLPVEQFRYTPEKPEGRSVGLLYALQEQSDPEPPPALVPTPFDQIDERGILLPSVIYSFELGPFEYRDNPYPVLEAESEDNTGGGFAPPFIDPLPTVVSVTADANHNVVATANAGPTDAGQVATWWEVEYVPGNTESIIQIDYNPNNQFSVNRNHIDTFVIPNGLDFRDKRIRFVIQAQDDGTQIWKSLYLRMPDEEEFDNLVAEVITIPAEPTPSAPPFTELEVNIQATQALQAELAEAARLSLDFDATSRYKLAKPFIDRSVARGVELAALPQLSDFYDLGSTYRIHRTRSTDVGFLDRIAVEFFGPGNERLWWVIAYANAIADPELDMREGEPLLIPSRQAVQAFLSRRSV